MSVKNLVYLTSEQALQDAANFIEFLKKKYKLHGNKWIVFGGSYPGSLAAWFRLKYPHLAAGAVASSAPVKAVLDFETYIEAVDTSIGSQCVEQIRKATTELEGQIKAKQWQEISKTFNLCDTLDGENINDLRNFVETLAGNIEGVVQYNKDNRAFEVKGNSLFGIFKSYSIRSSIRELPPRT